MTEELTVTVAVSLDAPEIEVSPQERQAIIEQLQGTRIADILTRVHQAHREWVGVVKMKPEYVDKMAE